MNISIIDNRSVKFHTLMEILDSVFIETIGPGYIHVQGHITIQFFQSEIYHGYCDADHKHIKIYIDDTLTVKEILSTFIHELIHAYQMVMGYLVLLDCANLWLGNYYHYSDYDDDWFFDTPWEVEAYKLEKKIFEKLDI